MPYEIPEIHVSDPERLWLNEVYFLFRRGEQVNIRRLKSILWEKIPRDFDPMAIDGRLIMHGTQITLLGILHANPRTDLIEKTDQVIKSTRELLLQDSDRKTITAEEIGERTRIPSQEVAIIFRQIGLLGPFWYTASSDGKTGYGEIQIEEGRNFDAFYRYEGIESLLKSFSDERAQSNSRRPVLRYGPQYTEIEIPQFTYDIFLSYSSKDSEQARSIYQAIADARGKVFLAEKSLKPGDEFDDKIRESLIKSRELWLLVTPNSLKSEWVCTEWGAAWALERKIVPILFRCEPQELPDRLKRKHTTDLHKLSDLIESTFSS